MAITLNKRPSVITPGFNQMMFQATSNQTAQPNFKYYVQINVDGNVLSPLVLPARPVTADVIFDIQPLVQDYLKAYFPFGLDGWQQCTKSIINVTVNVGERYGSPLTIYPGTTETYKPFYASLSNEQMMTYSPFNYSYVNGALNGYGSIIRNNKDDCLVFYWLLENAGNLTGVQVDVYDSSNVLISTSSIPNPLTAVSTANQLICIDVSPKAMALLSALEVGGTYPIPSNGAKYVYTFIGGVNNSVYTLNVEDCCGLGEENPSTLFFVNKKGAFDHINFCNRVKEDIAAIQTSYRPIDQYFKTSYRNSGGGVVAATSPLNQSVKILGNTFEKNKTYTSAPLTESEYTMLQDCFNSPAILIQKGDKFEYVSSKDLTFGFKKKVIEKVIQFVMNVKNNLIERRQSHG